MKQKIITLFLVVLIAGLMSLVVIGSNNKEKQAAANKVAALKDGSPILYYGDTCPHCKDVEEWLKSNAVEEKIQLIKKEVWNNRQNAAELSKVAASCGLDVSNIGVPFLYAEEKCLVGTPDIVKYFSDKLNITTAAVENINEATGAANPAEGTTSATAN